MKRVVAIVRDAKFDQIKNALVEIGIEGMTVSDVKGRGKQLGIKETYRGSEYCIDLLPKTKIELIVKKEQLDTVINTIIENGKTGSIGDGKIFVSNIERVIRIRTEDENEEAI
jgi:nitrogen regulatory protein P-II 1